MGHLFGPPLHTETFAGRRFRTRTSAKREGRVRHAKKTNIWLLRTPRWRPMRKIQNPFILPNRTYCRTWASPLRAVRVRTKLCIAYRLFKFGDSYVKNERKNKSDQYRRNTDSTAQIITTFV